MGAAGPSPKSQLPSNIFAEGIIFANIIYFLACKKSMIYRILTEYEAAEGTESGFYTR